LIDRLVNYKLDAVLSDVPISSSEAEPLAQTEIASEAVCLVTRKKSKKANSEKLSTLFSKGLYLPAKSSPITSALLNFISAEIKTPAIRGFIDDIAFLRLLALETDCLVAIPKIGIRREVEAGELHIVHEFKKMTQSYFLVYRQKGKRHPMLNLLLKG
jgi:DNA-binding transcriptional LysR family regulator